MAQAPSVYQKRQRRGDTLVGSSSGPAGLHYESIDPSYYVRSREFFSVGRVFAVMWNETAGSHAGATAYNSSISLVGYKDNYVHTQTRRFVVVRAKREFCFACPIFTYGGRATTKPGVRSSEHAVAYSWGEQPSLLPGETGITKASIGVVMTGDSKPLHPASRIYFGIHHPIQYNVKVKDIGYVIPDHVPSVIGNWIEEDEREIGQGTGVTAAAEHPELSLESRDELVSEDDDELGDELEEELEEETKDKSEEPEDELEEQKEDEPEEQKEDEPEEQKEDEPEEQKEDESEEKQGDESESIAGSDGLTSSTYLSKARPNFSVSPSPRAFFKKGRVFITPWAEPDKSSGEGTMKLTQFAVVKPKNGFAICLRISTMPKQPTADKAFAALECAAVIPIGGSASLQPYHTFMGRDPIEVKVENPDVTIEPNSCINLARPFTIEHDRKICNVGRVVGVSVRLLDEYFAENLGHTKASS